MELIERMSEFLKKIKIMINDDFRKNFNFDLLNNLLQLLKNFKLYPSSSFNVPLKTVKQILFKLKQAFFILKPVPHPITVERRKDNSELDLDSDEKSINYIKRIKRSRSTSSEENLVDNYIKSNYSNDTEKLYENILSGISSILNDEIFNYNDT